MSKEEVDTVRSVAVEHAILIHHVDIAVVRRIGFHVDSALGRRTERLVEAASLALIGLIP